MREGRLDIKFIDIYFLNPSDGGALLMIRVLYVGTGLPRISMDQGGFQCGIGGVAVDDKLQYMIRVVYGLQDPARKGG